LLNLVVIWYTITRFGMFCQQKSGNPASGRTFLLLSELASRKSLPKGKI
jgi:hypothetical protein